MKVIQQKSCSVRSNATVVPVIRTSLKSSRRGPTRGCGSNSRGVTVISAAAATLVETSTYMPSITYTSDMLIGKFYVPAMVLPLTFQRLVARSTGESFRSVAVVHEMDMLAPGEGEVSAGLCSSSSSRCGASSRAYKQVIEYKNSFLSRPAKSPTICQNRQGSAHSHVTPHTFSDLALAHLTALSWPFETPTWFTSPSGGCCFTHFHTPQHQGSMWEAGAATHTVSYPFHRHKLSPGVMSGAAFL